VLVQVVKRVNVFVMVKQHVNHAVLVYVHELDQRDVRRWRGVVRELVDESGISLDQTVLGRALKNLLSVHLEVVEIVN